MDMETGGCPRNTPTQAFEGRPRYLRNNLHLPPLFVGFSKALNAKDQTVRFNYSPVLSFPLLPASSVHGAFCVHGNQICASWKPLGACFWSLQEVALGPNLHKGEEKRRPKILISKKRRDKQKRQETRLPTGDCRNCYFCLD